MASDEKLGKNMLFPLAEKMVEKFVNESKIDAEAGTGLTVNYIQIIPQIFGKAVRSSQQ